ncbi:MAG: chorismate synthase [Bacillota bacterium]|nr:chorismate synthase [Bacillota bacterium]MDK2925541.1 chorismate synthase [Bacillota bacterium]
MRFLTAGESHGPALVAVVEGFPAGVPIDKHAIDGELARRQRVAGRGARSTQIEADEVAILSGVRGGLSLGSPIALQIKNRDWPEWEPYLSPFGEVKPGRQIFCPRPGHADLAGGQKYGFADLRNVLERASARSTAARTAVGALARQFLAQLGVRITGYVASIGKVELPPQHLAGLSLEEIARRVAASPVLVPDPATETAMLEAIAAAQEAGDTLGGTFVVLASGLPPGLGSHVEWDRRLDGRLGQALLSIPAVKGVAIGDAFDVAEEPGSTAHDAIFYSPGQGYRRASNRAGGLEGGITNGELLVVTAAVKPIPTLLKNPLPSVNILTREPARAAVERSDTCAVPAACVVGEAAVAWELARAVMEKFGGDTLEEIQAAWNRYKAQLENWPH